MKLLILLFTAGIFTFANAVSWSFLESTFAGGKPLPSYKNEVSAYGYNFRQYTWIDPAGRVCTTAMTDSKGLGIDCEFPPANFDYAKFQQGAK